MYGLLLFFLLFIRTLLFSNCDKETCEECPWHFQQSILYWTANEEGLEFTNKPSNILVTSDFTNRKLIDPDFKWSYGTRFKVGYNKHCSPWTFYFSWTYMPSKATGNKSVNPEEPDFEGMFPIWSMSPETLAGDYVTSARVRWHLHTNILDLDAQYNLNTCRNLVLSPLFGIRCAILHQKLHVKYSGGTFFNGFDDNSLRNRFTGIGPRFGINGAYYLCRGFTLIGLAAITPMYSHFNTSLSETYLNETRFEKHHKENRLAMSYDYQIGLQWTGKILQNMPNLLLTFAWEGHLFTNQNRMYRGNFNFFRKDRNLLLEGVSFGASFCF